jgi:phage gpG-like protein
MANSKVGEILDRKFNEALKGLPAIIGNEAVNFSQERFVQQDWLSNGSQPWQQRKINNRGSQGRKILIKSGRLWRATRIIDSGDRFVVIGNDVPYAAIHNYGGEIHQSARSETFRRNRLSRGINKGRFKKGTSAGRGLTFKQRVIAMPKRQFIGNSPELIKRLNAKAQQYILSRVK